MRSLLFASNQTAGVDRKNPSKINNFIERFNSIDPFGIKVPNQGILTVHKLQRFNNVKKLKQFIKQILSKAPSKGDLEMDTIPHFVNSNIMLVS